MEYFIGRICISKYDKSKSKEISSLFEAIYFNIEEIDIHVFLNHLSCVKSEKSLKERIIELPLLDYGIFSVNVKVPSQQIISFHLKKYENLSKLKEKISKEINIKKEDLKLTYQSNDLIDDEKLLSEIVNDNFIFELKNENFNKWRIYIKKLNGIVKTIYVDDKTKVEDFKIMITEIENIELEKLNLNYRGKYMENNYYLTDYNVEKEDMLIFTLNGDETDSISLTIEKIKLQKLMKKKKQNLKEKKYPITRVLGSGQFGTVYLSEKKGREPLAIKKVPVPSSENCNLALKEFVKAVKFNHQNLLKLHESYISIEDGMMYFMSVADYCNHGDLQNFLMKNKLSKSQMIDFCIQIMTGINHINSNEMIHRDLKPQNIFLNKEDEKITLVIGDYGFLTNSQDSKKSKVGTENYLAPEVMRNQYDVSADIFSFGCILYNIITRKEQKFYINCLSDTFQEKLIKELNEYDVPKELKEITMRCLQVDPKKRPISEEILRELNQIKRIYTL